MDAREHTALLLGLSELLDLILVSLFDKSVDSRPHNIVHFLLGELRVAADCWGEARLLRCSQVVGKWLE